MKKFVLVLMFCIVAMLSYEAFADTLKPVSNKDGIQCYEYIIGAYHGKVITSSTSTLKDALKTFPYYNKVEDIMITNMYAMTFADIYGWAAFTNNQLPYKKRA